MARRGLPGRQHFDPAEVPRLLRYIVFVDVLEDGRDLRVRLAGTATRPIFGRDPAGLTYRETFGEAARDVLGNYRHVMGTRLPSFRAGRSLIKSVPAYRALERVIFPRGGRRGACSSRRWSWAASCAIDAPAAATDRLPSAGDVRSASTCAAIQG